MDYRDAETCLAFLRSLDKLEITKQDLDQALGTMQIGINSLRGVIFYTGLSDSWVYRKFESWEYIYFFGPFLSPDACAELTAGGISFVGVDCFQLEHPIINFQGQELPIILNPDCRRYVSNKLDEVEFWNNHKGLLGNDILIYENLNIPAQLKDALVQFVGVPWNIRIDGVNDNTLVRPFVSPIQDDGELDD